MKVKSIHAQLWWESRNSFKMFMVVSFLNFPLSLISCLLLSSSMGIPFLFLIVEIWGFSYPALPYVFSTASASRDKQQEDRDSKIKSLDFDPSSWDESSMDCKAWFPLSEFWFLWAPVATTMRLTGAGRQLNKKEKVNQCQQTSTL